MLTQCSFDTTQNRFYCYKGKNCMKNFCADLREHKTEIINYEKRNDTLNKKKKRKCIINKKFTIYAQKDLLSMMAKKNFKVKDHCQYTGKYTGTAHDICNLRYKITENIPVVFHNGSTYDYHFITKALAIEFEGEFECLVENTKKYLIFAVPIKKKIRKIDKDENDKIVNRF